MNGVPEFYEVKMKQTSKGIWYCDGIVASTENMEDSIRIADIAMIRIETVLKAHNAEEQPVKETKWAKAVNKFEDRHPDGKPLKKEEK